MNSIHQGTMENDSETTHVESSSSATAKHSNKYSAQELGEIINATPYKLASVDIGLCTDWYTNVDYMELMLTNVKDVELRKQVCEYILLMQDRQTHQEHHPKVCQWSEESHMYVPYVKDLKNILHSIQVRIIHNNEVNAKLHAFAMEWSHTNDMVQPSYSESHTDAPQYFLNDLPVDVKNQIMISSDTLYSNFVSTLQGPINNWISKRNKKDWNVVRFICRLRGIVSRTCSIRVFGKLLEFLNLGNQESNMKQRPDANSDRNFKDYDDPRKRTNFWQLHRDGTEVEKLLEHIIKGLAA